MTDQNEMLLAQLMTEFLDEFRTKHGFDPYPGDIARWLAQHGVTAPQPTVDVVALEQNAARALDSILALLNKLRQGRGAEALGVK